MWILKVAGCATRRAIHILTLNPILTLTCSIEKAAPFLERLRGADDETRTRDPHLGKVMRYQLRYIRMRNQARFLGQSPCARYWD